MKKYEVGKYCTVRSFIILTTRQILELSNQGKFDGLGM
jgi:hypothetical protein